MSPVVAVVVVAMTLAKCTWNWKPEVTIKISILKKKKKAYFHSVFITLHYKNCNTSLLTFIVSVGKDIHQSTRSKSLKYGIRRISIYTCNTAGFYLITNIYHYYRYF